MHISSPNILYIFFVFSFRWSFFILPFCLSLRSVHVLREITMILAPISISNFKAHNKSHIDRVFNYFALICNTNFRAEKKKQTLTFESIQHFAAEERRTPITCAQLCDIIYSNFSNRSIKLRSHFVSHSSKLLLYMHLARNALNVCAL